MEMYPILNEANKVIPIVISVENISEIEQTCNLFSLLEKDKNDGLKIKNELSLDVDYNFIKMMLFKKSFLIAKTIISFEDISTLESVVRFNTKDIFGRVYEIPIPFIQSFDLWQMQENCIEIKRSFNLEAGFCLNMILKPKQKISFGLFPLISYCGEITPCILELKNDFNRKIDNTNINSPLFIDYIKTKNITNGIIHPDWDMGITHIRTVGFFPSKIVVGNSNFYPDSSGTSVFEVSKIPTHTPMKIEIPKDINGYILYYKSKN